MTQHNHHEWPKPKTLFEGKHLRLNATAHWEFVERTRANSAIVVVAMTDDGKILFVEQFRPPVNSFTIELPAGLVGDENHIDNEEVLDAARRELEEETGYTAQSMSIVAEGPISPGLSNEFIYLIKATSLTRTSTGGGVEEENIIVHEIPLEELEAWISKQMQRGKMVDPKVFSGLYFIK